MVNKTKEIAAPLHVAFFFFFSCTCNGLVKSLELKPVSQEEEYRDN